MRLIHDKRTCSVRPYDELSIVARLLIYAGCSWIVRGNDEEGGVVSLHSHQYLWCEVIAYYVNTKPDMLYIQLWNGSNIFDVNISLLYRE